MLPLTLAFGWEQVAPLLILTGDRDVPMSQMCPGEHWHTFAGGLSLARLDAVVRGNDAAGRFLAGRTESALAARGAEAVQYYHA